MKKSIYILIVAVLLGGVGIYLFTQRGTSTQKENEIKTIAPGDEMNWSAYFPAVVPEYPEGDLSDLSLGDQTPGTRFPNSASAVVDNTTLEEVQSYIEERVSDGWLVTSENSQGEDYNSFQLSFEENRMSLSIGEGTLRLSTYTEGE